MSPNVRIGAWRDKKCSPGRSGSRLRAERIDSMARLQSDAGAEYLTLNLDGTQRILEKTPQSLHERTTLLVGSKAEMELLHQFLGRA